MLDASSASVYAWAMDWKQSLIVIVHRDAWKLKPHTGITSTLRQHLDLKHGVNWRKMVVLHHFKGYKQYNANGTKKTQAQPAHAAEAVQELVTVQGLVKRLVHFMAVDDQVQNIQDAA